MSRHKHPLRSAREARNWSLDNLADLTGLSPRTLLRAEQGRGLNPSSRQLICKAFGMPADELGLTSRQVGASASGYLESDEFGRRLFERPKRITVVHVGPRDATPVLTAADLPEVQHIIAVLDDPRQYLDGSVVDYLLQQLDCCKADDGNLGPARALPTVLGILGTIQDHARDVKPGVRRALLEVGADGAEFAGWLYRDLHDLTSASYWLDRAMEWAQEAGDLAMQGYVLLRKSQMAYEERDAVRVLTLAQAAQYGPWRLPLRVQAEVTQQEARGLAMLREPIGRIEQKLDAARTLLSGADVAEECRLGLYYNEDTSLLRTASCYIEAGNPAQAASMFGDVLKGGELSRRDEAYFRARRAVALGLSGEPDDAAAEGLAAWSIATETKSQRTARELARAVKVLEPWSRRPGLRELREAMRAP